MRDGCGFCVFSTGEVTSVVSGTAAVHDVIGVVGTNGTGTGYVVLLLEVDVFVKAGVELIGGGIGTDNVLVVPDEEVGGC